MQVIPCLCFPSAEQLNEKGIQFYNDTINSLLENNITPIVSLYHWDLPQVRQYLSW